MIKPKTSEPQWTHEELGYLLELADSSITWDLRAARLNTEYGSNRDRGFFTAEVCRRKYLRLNGESGNKPADRAMMDWIKQFLKKSVQDTGKPGEIAKLSRVRRNFDFLQHCMNDRLTDDQIAELVGLDVLNMYTSSKLLENAGAAGEAKLLLAADKVHSKMTPDDWKNVKSPAEAIKKLDSLPVNMSRLRLRHPEPMEDDEMEVENPPEIISPPIQKIQSPPPQKSPVIAAIADLPSGESPSPKKARMSTDLEAKIVVEQIPEPVPVVQRQKSEDDIILWDGREPIAPPVSKSPEKAVSPVKSPLRQAAESPEKIGASVRSPRTTEQPLSPAKIRSPARAVKTPSPVKTTRRSEGSPRKSPPKTPTRRGAAAETVAEHEIMLIPKLEPDSDKEIIDEAMDDTTSVDTNETPPRRRGRRGRAAKIREEEASSASPRGRRPSTVTTPLPPPEPSSPQHPSSPSSAERRSLRPRRGTTDSRPETGKLTSPEPLKKSEMVNTNIDTMDVDLMEGVEISDTKPTMYIDSSTQTMITITPSKSHRQSSTPHTTRQSSVATSAPSDRQTPTFASTSVRFIDVEAQTVMLKGREIDGRIGIVQCTENNDSDTKPKRHRTGADKQMEREAMEFEHRSSETRIRVSGASDVMRDFFTSVVHTELDATNNITKMSAGSDLHLFGSKPRTSEQDWRPKASANQKAVLISALNMIAEYPKAVEFREAVTDDLVEGYSNVVKLPFDLGTIRDLIDNDEIITLRDLNSHLHLMCLNAIMFNDDEHTVNQDARDLRDYCTATINGMINAAPRKTVQRASSRRSQRGGSANGGCSRSHLQSGTGDTTQPLVRRTYYQAPHYLTVRRQRTNPPPISVAAALKNPQIVD